MARFDVIFVNGAISRVPESWLNQLAQGGRLVVIEDDGHVGARGVVYAFG